ncbi:hypothetical protein QPK87_36305 [Kamptonema cortianum]|nr:hypothetical protein [Kamptonema cortianum]MDL5050092.1 hypothetical protein [Oscillatoria amoena NRMC-F 0135]
MPKITLITGSLLILLGILSYVLTGMESKTALIPSFFGILYVILGALGHKDNLRKHVMHVAAALALLSLFATGRGTLNAIKLISGAAVEVARPAAAYAMGIMFLISLIFLILCIRSFVIARLLRKSTNQSPQA